MAPLSHPLKFINRQTCMFEFQVLLCALWKKMNLYIFLYEFCTQNPKFLGTGLEQLMIFDQNRRLFVATLRGIFNNDAKVGGWGPRGCKNVNSSYPSKVDPHQRAG